MLVEILDAGGSVFDNQDGEKFNKSSATKLNYSSPGFSYFLEAEG